MAVSHYKINSDGLIHISDHLEDAHWHDLLNPTAAEEKILEDFLKITIPTRLENSFLKTSSRLYVNHQATFAAASFIYLFNKQPELHSLRFIFTKNSLITIRYAPLNALDDWIKELPIQTKAIHNIHELLLKIMGLLLTDFATYLEKIDIELDQTNALIFKPNQSNLLQNKPEMHFESILKDVGELGNGLSSLKEVLFSFSRLNAFFVQLTPEDFPPACLKKLNAQRLDLQSLNEHTSFMTEQLTFQLDATLGMISIQQNRSIELFSVFTITLMPPTLIAAIYGMNFEVMPELTWPFGYGLSLAFMLSSMLASYLYFNKKTIRFKKIRRFVKNPIKGK
jgi:magnesium transporter